MAKTCNHCGYAYNSDEAASCAICNSPIDAVDDVNLSGAGYLGQGTETPLVPTLSGHPSAISGSKTHAQVDSTASPGSTRQLPQNILEGRISYVKERNERPERSVYKVIAGILIGLLVIIPFGGLFLVSGMLSFSFAFLGFPSLSQLFNPIIWMTSSFELLEVMVLRRMNRPDTFPVYRGVVENSSGEKHNFKLTGPLSLGDLLVGHHVRLSGNQRNGTLVVRQGYDATTGTVISSAYRNPWKAIFFGILGLDAMAVLTAFLYFKGIIG